MKGTEPPQGWQSLQLQILRAASTVAPGDWIGPGALRRLAEPGSVRLAVDQLHAHDLLTAVEYREPCGAGGARSAPDVLPESIAVSDYGRWLVAAFESSAADTGDTGPAR